MWGALCAARRIMRRQARALGPLLIVAPARVVGLILPDDIFRLSGAVVDYHVQIRPRLPGSEETG